MPGRLATVWRFRHFWLSLAGLDLRVRYRRSVLGIGWSLLHPVVMTLVFCVAFASWLGTGDWRTGRPVLPDRAGRLGGGQALGRPG